MRERDILNPTLIIEASLDIMDDFEADFGEIYNTGTITPVYAGPYEVSPSSVEKILSTKDLRMTKDVIVKPIAVRYVLNDDGSTTAIIGGEINE